VDHCVYFNDILNFREHPHSLLKHIPVSLETTQTTGASDVNSDNVHRSA
jgi:hypothetical protein